MAKPDKNKPRGNSDRITPTPFIPEKDKVRPNTGRGSGRFKDLKPFTETRKTGNTRKVATEEQNILQIDVTIPDDVTEAGELRRFVEDALIKSDNRIRLRSLSEQFQVDLSVKNFDDMKTVLSTLVNFTN